METDLRVSFLQKEKTVKDKEQWNSKRNISADLLFSYCHVQVTVLKNQENYAAAFSPGGGALGGRTRQVLLGNEKHNFRLVSEAVG